jgi:hypothetical protein
MSVPKSPTQLDYGGAKNTGPQLSFLGSFKDIVQPKKRGVERGTIRTVLTSYTIADIF